MKNSKMFGLMALVGLIVVALVIAGVIAQSGDGLEDELSSLIQELEDSGYSWLVDYGGSISPRIEIYEIDEDNKIAEFTSLNDNEYNKVILTGLIGSQDRFDLLVLDGAVEFDHIIDPAEELFNDGFEDTGDWDQNFDGNGVTGFTQETEVCYNGLLAGSPHDGTYAAYGEKADTTLISDDIDTSGVTAILVDFWYCLDDLEADDFVLDYWNGASYVEIAQLGGGLEDTWLHYTETVTDSQFFKTDFRIQFDGTVMSGFGDQERLWIDEVIISDSGVIDNEYPFFSSFSENPVNNTPYVSGAIYEFNVTVTATNGTVGLEFNNTNYTATNLTATLYNVTIVDIKGGAYDYYWFGWGNGTDTNYDTSSVRSYTVNTEFPGVTINLPASGSAYGVNSASFNVSLSRNGSVIYSLDGGINNISMTGDQGAFGTSFVHTNNSIADGSYTFSVYANDTLGNNNYTESKTFAVDTTNPSVSFQGDTPAADSTQEATSIVVNLSSSDSLTDHYAFTDFDNDLLLWMRMDDADSSGEPIDLSSYSNNGTFIGGAAITTGGKFGNGSELDGTDGGINLTSPQVFDDLTDFTISMWVNPASISHIGLSYLVASRSSSTHWSVGVIGTNPGCDSVDGTIYFLNGTGAAILCSSSAITINQWSHVLVSYNSSENNLSFYLDGLLDGSGINSVSIDPSANLYLGSIGGTTFTLDGTMDEVLLFNRTLSAGEVSALYNATATQYFNTYSGLSESTHSFTGYAVDLGGNKADTGLRSVTISSPDTTNPSVSFGDGTPAADSTQANTDIFVNLSTSDNNGDHYAFSDFDNDLVLWMRMDDTNSSGDPTDLSSNSYNGSLVADALINSTGKFGNASHFDGTGDYIQFSTSAADLTYNFSYGAWFRFNEAPGVHSRIIAKGNNEQYEIFYDYPLDRLKCRVRDGSSIDASYSPGSFIGTGWHHVFCVVNSNNVTIYYDGQYVAGTALSDGTLETSTDPLRIAEWGDTGNTKALNGSVDEVVIFNRTLTATEVSALYNATATQYTNNFTSLSDGSHSFTGYAVDLAGNKNDTGSRSVTIDSTFPTWTNNDTNLTASTPVGELVKFNVTFSDTNAGSYIFDWYNGTAWENSSGSYMSGSEISVTKTINIDIASINWSWWGNDTVGNTNHTDVWSIVLSADDNTAPDVTINFPASGTVYGYSSLDFNVSLSENGSVSYSLDGGLINVSMTGDEGVFGTAFNYTNASLGDGAYTFSVYANDTAGNNNYTESVSFTVDATQPAISFGSGMPAAGATTGSSVFVNLSSSDAWGDHYAFVQQTNTVDEFSLPSFGDLLLWMRMDDVSGSNPTDISLYQQGGVLFGNALINSTGYWGDASHFDGNGDYINISETAELRFDDQGTYTWSAWINLNAVDKEQRIFHYGELGLGQEGYIIEVESDNNFAIGTPSGFGDSYVSKVATTKTLSANTWYHVAVTFNTESDISVYVDGVLNASGSGSFADSLTRHNLRLGYIDARTLDGALDDVLIFNRSLSAGEIASLYNATATQYENTLSNLPVGVNYFLGNAVDRVGNRNNTAVDNDFWRSVTVDLEVPGVTINKPTSGELFGTDDLPLNFSVTLNENGSVMYSLDSGLNNISMTSTDNQNFNALNNSIADGSYTFSVYANDTAGKNNFTESAVFSFDSVFPTISFGDGTPADASSQSNTDIYINLSTTDVSQHYAFSDFDNDLVLWMRMDDTNSSGDPIDLSSYSNNGSLVGDVFIDNNGHFGNASHFDGDGDYINIDAAVADLSSTTVGTWSAWVKPRDATPPALGSNIISFGQTDGFDKIHFLLIQGGNLSISITGGTILQLALFTDAAVFSDNVWTHVVIVQNGTEPVLYANGVKPAQTFSTTTDKSSWFFELTEIDNGRIGILDTKEDSGEFNGTIDDVLIFNRPLSAGEVSALYNATANQYTNNFTGLSDGAHSFTGYTIDRAGNKNDTGQRTVTTDSSAPGVTINQPTPVGVSLSTSSVDFNVTINENADSALYSLDGGVTNITMTNNGNVDFSATNSSIADGSYTVNYYVNDSVGNLNGTESRSFSVDTVFPLISYGVGTENDNEVSESGSIYVNVSVTETNEDTVTFLLYNSTGQVNSSSFTGGATRAINWTGLADAVYTYNITINDTAGNSNTTTSQTLTLVSSCLKQDSCAEDLDCTINSACVLNNELCSTPVCFFGNFTLNNNVYTLYNGSNGRDLDLDLLGKITFAPGVNFTFSGKNGSTISGAGSLGGSAGIVNITVPNLFNTTNAQFYGRGGYSTIDGVGGDGGVLQLNFRGLIRKFDIGTGLPVLTAGNSTNGAMGAEGSLIYNQNLRISAAFLFRDVDVTGDGRVTGSDQLLLELLYNTKDGDALFDSRADINGDSKINILDIVRLGFEWDTR